MAVFRFQIKTSGYDLIELICVESFQIFIDWFPFSDVLFTNDTADIYYHPLQENKYVKSEHSSFIFSCCEGSGQSYYTEAKLDATFEAWKCIVMATQLEFG